MVSKRAILGWCLYEAAIGPYTSIILTLVFAPYFVKSIATNPLVGTTEWGTTNAIANFVVALLAPFIGVICDLEGRRKPWIAFFTLLFTMSALFLWFAKPEQTFVIWSLVWISIGILGTELAFSFHGAMLFRLASGNIIAKASGWSRGLGFSGDLISLSIVLFFIIQPNTSFLPLDTSASERIRWSCVFVAIWIIVLSIPLFLFTPDNKSTGIGFRKAFQQVLSVLAHTIPNLWQHRKLFWYFLSNMAILTGLTGLSTFGAIYISSHFHLNTSQVIYFAIILAFISIMGSVSLGILDKHLGARNVLILSILMTSITSLGVLTTDSLTYFWMYAIFAAFFLGVTGAGLRSLLAQIAPPSMMAQIFSLNLLCGKLSAFIGPAIVTVLMLLFSSQQAGMLIIPFFLLMGAVSLCFI